MKHGQYNLIRVGLICSTLLFSPTGCGAKTVDCDIEGEHVHLYVSESNLLSRYIESEKERVKGLNRTDEYLPLTEELAQASENGLYPVEENLDYITTKLIPILLNEKLMSMIIFMAHITVMDLVVENMNMGFNMDIIGITNGRKFL